MGAGGVYPSNPYPDGFVEFNYSYQNPPTIPIPSQIPPYNYPPSYGTGFPRPYLPVHNYPPMVNGYHPGIHPNPMVGPGFVPLPRPDMGGLPAIPPPIISHGNIYLGRPGEFRLNERRTSEQRPPFEEQ